MNRINQPLALSLTRITRCGVLEIYLGGTRWNPSSVSTMIRKLYEGWVRFCECSPPCVLVLLLLWDLLLVHNQYEIWIWIYFDKHLLRCRVFFHEKIGFLQVKSSCRAAYRPYWDLQANLWFMTTIFLASTNS